MKVRVEITEVTLDDPRSWAELPDGSKVRMALSLQEHIDTGGGWEFTLPVSEFPFTKPDQRVKVSLEKFRKRDPETTFLLVQTLADYDPAERDEIDRNRDQHGFYRKLKEGRSKND